MADHLTSLFARGPESKAIRNIVQPAFQQAQQRVTRDSGLSLGPLKHAAELTFLQAIDAPQLLLLAQLKTIV